MSDQTLNIAILRFFVEYLPDPNNPQELIGRDWVEWVKKGESAGSKTQELVARLRGKNGVSAPEWEAVGPAYEAWKRNEEAPEVGTPLAAWPGVPRELADILKHQHVRTVEDLAQLPDHEMTKVRFPGLREIRARAKAFVEHAGSDVAVASAKIAEQQGQIEQLMAALAELQEARFEEDKPARKKA
jgi:hypothetical protein